MKNRNLTFNTKLMAGEVFSLIGIIILALVLGMILSSQVFAIAGVREISMEDTMFEGESLFVNKIAYRNNQPERGDVVVFLKAQEVNGFFERCLISLGDMAGAIGNNQRDNRLVKRVIGLPGETIEIKSGAVFINGSELNEPYVRNTTFPDMLDGEFLIPEDQYFMMGDNRIWSSDSRRFGPVSIKSIEGKASIIVWPPSKWTSLAADYKNDN